MNTLNEQNWPEQVTASPLPVLVIYHSPYSAHSRRSLALLTKLEPQFLTVRFASVDVDAQDNLARLNRIAAIPAFVVYRGGEKKASFMGEWGEKRLVENIARALAL